MNLRCSLPARVISFECFHVASIGIDLVLGAIAYGASQVRILLTDKVADGYGAALERQLSYAQTILSALGYGGAQAKEPVTLHEAEPYHCVRCGKPFGTKQLVDNMLGKLAGHSMYAGAGALKRLQMCGDCRVVDMMETKPEASIFDVPR